MYVPTEIKIYLKLIVDHKLEKKDIAKLRRIIVDYGPDDILSSVSMIRPDNEPEEVVVIHRKKPDSKHVYTYPLKRDLTESEVEVITQQWMMHFNGDFELESSANELVNYKRTYDDAAFINEDDYKNLCESIAKMQHQKWYKERTDNGWKYGQHFSRREKTHPMLRPWEDLPDKYKKIDTDIPKLFADELKRQGYLIVKTSELQKVIRDLKS